MVLPGGECMRVVAMYLDRKPNFNLELVGVFAYVWNKHWSCRTMCKGT